MISQTFFQPSLEDIIFWGAVGSITSYPLGSNTSYGLSYMGHNVENVHAWLIQAGYKYTNH